MVVSAPGAVPTATVTSTLDLPDKRAVTAVLLPLPLSLMDAAPSARLSVGRASSSVIVTATLVNVTPASVPSTLIVSFGSSMSSSVGVSVKSTCPLAAPAPIVMVWSATMA